VSGSTASPFLTSALEGGEWSASCPGRFNPGGKKHRYQLDRRLGGPHSRPGHYGQEKNLLPLPGIKPGPSSPYPIVLQTAIPDSKTVQFIRQRASNTWKDGNQQCLYCIKLKYCFVFEIILMSSNNSTINCRLVRLKLGWRVQQLGPRNASGIRNTEIFGKKTCLICVLSIHAAVSTNTSPK
jgi:hypothetical protein